MVGLFEPNTDCQLDADSLHTGFWPNWKWSLEKLGVQQKTKVVVVVVVFVIEQ